MGQREGGRQDTVRGRAVRSMATLGLVVAVTSCGGIGTPAGAPTTPPAVTEAPTAPPTPAVPAIEPTASPRHPAASPDPAPPSPDEPVLLTGSWTEAFTLPLADGFILRDCEGERPDICVYAGERLLGDVELLPAYPLDDRQSTLEPGALLHEWATNFLAHFAQDRAQGCPEFSFSADPVAESSVAGLPAVRTGFTLHDRDGRPVERVVNYFTLVASEVALVNVDAYAAEGGCLPPSDTDLSFEPEELASFERYLDALVGGTPLPSG